MQALPWTDKYRPKTAPEIQGQQTALEELTHFLKNHKKGQIALLHGPQGIGKTTMVHCVAASMDAELLEVNASDVRNEASITAVVGAALKQQSLFAKTKIILFDEVDGLSGSDDRGGLAAILALAKQTPYPVVMTANDIWDSKFATLRKDALVISVKPLAYTSIVPMLRRIAAAEHAIVDEESLKAIARRAGGDMRAAINDLQTLGADTSAASIETLSTRDTQDSIFNAIRIVLKTKDPLVARKALDAVQEDIDEIFLWMDENLPKEYRKPEDLDRAYQAFSQADVFRGRIRRWQHWRFLVYCYDLIGPGVSIAKAERYEGFTQLSRTQRIFAMWRAKSAKRDAIVAKLAHEQHTSKKQARKELAILSRSIVDAPWLAEEEQQWLQEKL